MLWLLLLCLIISLNSVNSLCTLPQQWSGKWYMGKDTDLMTIDKTTFINKGICIENKEDKFLFYENEECYRCVFVMQKHQNVLQYRASYCTEESDFNSNCENLSPESELVTIYRENAIPETCPLNGMYVLTKNYEQSSQDDANNEDRAYRSSSFASNCDDNTSNKNSMIMECSDHTMLKLQFGKCTSVPTFTVNCVAHWTEGNMNYLIGRISNDDANQKPTYKCLSYSEIANPKQKSTFRSIGNDQKKVKHTRRQPESQSQFDFADFLSNGEPLTEESNIQLAVSQDEFCRNIDTMIDEQFSFTFNKIQDSLHVSPASLKSITSINRKFRRHSNSNSSQNYALFTKNSHASRSISQNLKQNGHIYHTCKFPRWLNKKWHNLKQTKMFTIDYKLDSLLVLDQKSSVIINKFTCSHMRARKSNYVQAIVKTLNGCSSGYQCLTITSKSDFVLEIKFGKVHYGNNLVGICEKQNESEKSEGNGIIQEFVYVDTNYGVECPLKNGIYEKLNTKSNAYRSLNNFEQITIENDDQNEEEPCKYLTQTQTLQIGCQSDQQYSLRTKLCYPNHQYNKHDTSSSSSSLLQKDSSPFNIIVDNSNLHQSPKLTTSAYTQLESEINLVCLAHWKHNGNHVIVSRTMTNEVLCSIWSSSPDGKFLKLLEIDSNCNYDKNSSPNLNQNQINYGFVFKRSCSEKTKASMSSSYSIGTSVVGSSSLFSSMTVTSTSSSLLAPFYIIYVLLFFGKFYIPKS